MYAMDPMLMARMPADSRGGGSEYRERYVQTFKIQVHVTECI